MLEQLARVRELDDLALVHHGDAIGERFNGCEVVRHKHVATAELVLQLAQELDHASANRRIERGDRLVEQHQARFAGERPGDTDSLALSPGELVRIADRIVLLQTHLRQ